MRTEFIVRKSQIEGKTTKSYALIKLSANLYLYYDGRGVTLVDKSNKTKVVIGSKIKIKKSPFSDKVKIVVEWGKNGIWCNKDNWFCCCHGDESVKFLYRDVF